MHDLVELLAVQELAWTVSFHVRIETATRAGAMVVARPLAMHSYKAVVAAREGRGVVVVVHVSAGPRAGSCSV